MTNTVFQGIINHIVSEANKSAFPKLSMVTNIKLQSADGTMSDVEASLAMIDTPTEALLVLYNFLPTQGHTEDKKELLDWIKAYAAYYGLQNHLCFLNWTSGEDFLQQNGFVRKDALMYRYDPTATAQAV